MNLKKRILTGFSRYPIHFSFSFACPKENETKKPVFRTKSLWSNPLSLPTHKPQTAHTIRGQPALLDASNFQGDPNGVIIINTKKNG